MIGIDLLNLFNLIMLNLLMIEFKILSKLMKNGNLFLIVGVIYMMLRELLNIINI